jgi:hypothetical protein
MPTPRQVQPVHRRIRARKHAGEVALRDEHDPVLLRHPALRPPHLRVERHQRQLEHRHRPARSRHARQQRVEFLLERIDGRSTEHVIAADLDQHEPVAELRATRDPHHVVDLRPGDRQVDDHHAGIPLDNRWPARAVLAADAGGDRVAEDVDPVERSRRRIWGDVVRQLDRRCDHGERDRGPGK